MFGWLKRKTGEKKEAVKRVSEKQAAAHQRLMDALERRKRLFGEALLVEQKERGHK